MKKAAPERGRPWPTRGEEQPQFRRFVKNLGNTGKFWWPGHFAPHGFARNPLTRPFRPERKIKGRKGGLYAQRQSNSGHLAKKQSPIKGLAANSRSKTAPEMVIVPEYESRPHCPDWGS
jgi:hypothetical protein